MVLVMGGEDTDGVWMEITQEVFSCAKPALVTWAELSGSNVGRLLIELPAFPDPAMGIGIIRILVVF